MSNGQSSILSTIGVGAMLEFSQSNSGSIVAQQYEGDTFLGLGAGSENTFTVTMYEFNGMMEAKISLTEAGAYWVAVTGSVAGVDNPLLLGPEPGQFLLTDTGGGQIAIQNTMAPPPPYVQVVSAPFAHLGFGFDEPLLSLFEIGVVG